MKRSDGWLAVSASGLDFRCDNGQAIRIVVSRGRSWAMSCAEQDRLLKQHCNRTGMTAQAAIIDALKRVIEGF